MRAETALDIINEIVTDTEDLGIEVLLPRLRDAVLAQASSPTADAQRAVAELREELNEALSRSIFNKYPPGRYKIIEAMKIGQFLGDNLRLAVDEAFQGSEITPTIVADELERLDGQFQLLYTRSNEFIKAATYFEITRDELQPSEFEVAVTIPGRAINDELEQLGKETLRINRTLSVFSEIATGSREPIKVRAVASTDPTYYLASVPAVALCIATALERAAALYEKVLNIIKLHRDLRAAEVPKPVLEGMKKHIDDTVAKGLGAIARQIEKEHFPKIDEGRRPELKIELKKALEDIARRLDEGYTFDVRGEAPAPPEEGEEETANSRAIREAARIVEEVRPQLQRFEAEEEPILLIGKREED